VTKDYAPPVGLHVSSEFRKRSWSKLRYRSLAGLSLLTVDQIWLVQMSVVHATCRPAVMYHKDNSLRPRTFSRTDHQCTHECPDRRKGDVRQVPSPNDVLDHDQGYSLTAFPIIARRACNRPNGTPRCIRTWQFAHPHGSPRR